jgi:hypothetical protein
MMTDQNDECSKETNNEEMKGPGLEDEEDEAGREYEQKETRPRLTLINPSKDQNSETDPSDDDPPGWPEF